MKKNQKLKQLNKDLLDIYSYIKPTKEDKATRKYVVDAVLSQVKLVFPEAEISTFGSYETGLYIPSSDIDIVIITENENPNKILNKVKESLIVSGFVDRFTLLHLGKAKIPILKFKDRIYNYKFDLSVNNRNGISAANYIKKALIGRKYLKLFCMVFKYYIVSRGLGDAALGGINSYSQFLLVYNFFQLHPLIQNKHIDPIKNVGVLFMDFFQYYGFDFSYKNVKISVDAIGYKKNFGNGLSVEDPTDFNTDVGSCCRCIPICMDVFRQSYEVMAYLLTNEISYKSLAFAWIKICSDEKKERNRRRKIYISNAIKE